MKIKKIISAIMAFAMIVSMMGVGVYAVGEEKTATTSADGFVAKVGDTSYASIDEAIAAWTNGTTLTLLTDVTLSDVIKLSSTEHHILDLGIYTMTAASGKDAIVIQACGTGSAEKSAITINADSTDPGGINAGKKSVIYYKYADGGISTDDRPIIKINGGVFAGSTSSFGTAGIYTIGTAARKCATLNISGGTFNCSINGSNKSKLLISGGTFNYSVGSQGDSTALRLISGGTFKTLGFMTADSNNTKFWIGTSMGNSNVGVYVDDNGYIVVGGTPITEAGDRFEAYSENYSNASNYLKYSSAAANGLYYTSVEEALADNNKTTGSVTVHVDELDMTSISYTGTIVVPEGETLTITNAPAGLKVKDTAGNDLDAVEVNGKLIYGNVPAPAAPTGTNSPAYTKEVDGYVRVWGEGGGNASESFVLKLYSGEELIATTQLNDIGGIIDGDVHVTWNFYYPTSNDEYWTTTWEDGHPKYDAQPTKVELYIDGTLVATTDAKMSGADDINPVVWAELGGVEKPAKTYQVATKAELDAAIASAVDGDTILLTADIDYTGTATPEINKAVTLDLGEKTLTTNGTYGGLRLKGNCSIKNGTLAHKGTVTAIKAWNVEAIEDLVIDVAFREGKTIGGIVIQENAAGIGRIKNVTIKGEGLTNGIETYNCGNATENVIGSMENVTIDANGTGMLISAPCGTATNCSINGDITGIELWIKGTYSATLNLVDCDVEGGEKALFVHDEFSSNPDVVNNGTLKLTADDASTFVSENGKALEYTIARAEKVELSENIMKLRSLSGTGTEEDPYLINNIDELKWFRDDVNSGNTYSGQYVKVADDVVIDLAGEEWAPIGNSTNNFQGSFDGNGVVIKNLVITGNNSNVGFFGFTTDGKKASVIKNITVENARVSGRLNVGVVAGTPYTTEYSNITVTGHVEVNGMAYVGGVFGKNVYANLTDITVNVDASSYVKAVSTENGTAYRTYVGGVIGFMGEGGHTVKNVTSNIRVDGDVCDIGGITGIAHYGNKFEGVTCSGTVTGPEDETEIGGIAGTWNNTKDYTVTFTNCEYTGESDVGAIGAAYTPANNTEDTSGKLIIDGNIAWPKALPVAEVGGVQYEILQEAFAAADQNETVTLLTDVAVSETIKVTKNNITLDLNGKTITGTDTTTNSFALIEIQPGAELTINDTVGTGKITLTSTNNRSWNAYSSVISNQRGKLTVNGGTIEHLGGTDMAYGIDNLTNGKGTYAETIINGGTIKSTYRAVRQFLNGVEAQNILTINGGTIEGANKAIFFHDPSKNANNGKITIDDDAVINGDVYLFVTEGSTEWPVEVSISSTAVVEEKLMTKNIPEGYELKTVNGAWTVGTKVPAEEDVTLDTRNLTIVNMGKVTDDNGVERFCVAFCAGIDSLNYKEVGFEIRYPGLEWERTLSTTVVYESLTVNRTDGTTANYTPSMFGGGCKYIFFKTALFGSRFDNQELKWRAYAIKFDGTKLVGKTSTINDIYTLED